MQQSEDKELGIEVEDGLEVDDGQLSREEIEKIPGNFLNKVNMLQTRAIYMAGFSYYAVRISVFTFVKELLLHLYFHVDWILSVVLLRQ